MKPRWEGPLAEPLGRGEKPEDKLPILYEVLGVDAGDRLRAVLVLASLIVPGFRDAKKAVGRPHVLTELTGESEPYSLAANEAWLFEFIEDLLANGRTAGGRPYTILDATRLIVSSEHGAQTPNCFYEPSPKLRSKRAEALKQLYTQRKRREAHHSKLLDHLYSRMRTLKSAGSAKPR